MCVVRIPFVLRCAAVVPFPLSLSLSLSLLLTRAAEHQGKKERKNCRQFGPAGKALRGAMTTHAHRGEGRCGGREGARDGGTDTDTKL